MYIVQRRIVLYCIEQSRSRFPVISRKIYDIWIYIYLEYVYKNDRIS